MSYCSVLDFTFIIFNVKSIQVTFCTLPHLDLGIIVNYYIFLSHAQAMAYVGIISFIPCYICIILVCTICVK
jgi:hypothetical protein